MENPPPTYRIPTHIRPLYSIYLHLSIVHPTNSTEQHSTHPACLSPLAFLWTKCLKRRLPASQRENKTELPIVLPFVSPNSLSISGVLHRYFQMWDLGHFFFFFFSLRSRPVGLYFFIFYFRSCTKRVILCMYLLSIILCDLLSFFLFFRSHLFASFKSKCMSRESCTRKQIGFDFLFRVAYLLAFMNSSVRKLCRFKRQLCFWQISTCRMQLRQIPLMMARSRLLRTQHGQCLR